MGFMDKLMRRSAKLCVQEEDWEISIVEDISKIASTQLHVS